MSAAAEFTRILQVNGISEDQFFEFSKLRYGKAVQAAYDAVMGEKKYAFLMANNECIMDLPETLMPETPSIDERSKQIFVDRIFEFYMMKYFHNCSKRQFKKRLKITGLDILERNVETGKGILLLNSQYGAEHLVPIILSRLGYHVTSIQSQNFYDKLGIRDLKVTVEQIADNFETKIRAVGSSVLKDKKILHMTAAGPATKNGLEFPFVGRKSHFSRRFADIAEQAKARCIPVLTRLDVDGTLNLSILPRITPNKFVDDREIRVEKMVQRYVNVLKTAWRDDPSNIPPEAIRNYLKF